MALAPNKKIRTLRNMAVNGSHVESGSVIEISAEDASYLIGAKFAEVADAKVELFNAPEPDAIAAQASAGASKAK